MPEQVLELLYLILMLDMVYNFHVLKILRRRTNHLVQRIGFGLLKKNGGHDEGLSSNAAKKRLGDVWISKLKSDTNYWVKYSNVQKANTTKRYDVKVVFNNPKGEISNAYGKDIAVFDGQLGAVRFRGYKHLDCTLYVYEHGTTKLISGNDNKLHFRFIDIDCNQAIEVLTPGRVNWWYKKSKVEWTTKSKCNKIGATRGNTFGAVGEGLADDDAIQIQNKADPSYKTAVRYTAALGFTPPAGVANTFKVRYYAGGTDADLALAQYRNNYKWNSLCQDSVPVAIRCFIESENYEGFLRNVLSLDCDADTIGAIGGGIAEEFYKETGFNDDELLKQYLDNYLFKKEDNSFVYDKDGNTLAKLRQNRDTDYIKYNDIPQEVVNAFVAVEDKRFYDHHGVDLQSTAKAVEILVRGKLGESTGVERGGSTITQQMVKNVFLSNKKTYARKLKEIFLALEVEKKYSKKEILEFYINNVYFYNNCYGIASAAQSYFSKDLDQLTLAETATLCAIPNSPYYYNPVSNYSNNKERRNLILKRMRDQGYITKKAYKTAKKSNTTVIQNQRDFYNYEVSYAIDCAVENLMKQDGFEFHYSFSSVRDYKDYRKRYLEEYDLMRKELFTGGYKIKTTIDHNAQEKLQKAVDSNLAQFTKKQKDGEFLVQGAATVVDNTTGKVIAIVGGRSQESEEGNGRTLNRAFQSYNQPGSTIKPLMVEAKQALAT